MDFQLLIWHLWVRFLAHPEGRQSGSGSSDVSRPLLFIHILLHLSAIVPATSKPIIPNLNSPIFIENHPTLYCNLFIIKQGLIIVQVNRLQKRPFYFRGIAPWGERQLTGVSDSIQVKLRRKNTPKIQELPLCLEGLS